MTAPASLRRILGSALVAFVAGIGVLTLVTGYSSDPAIQVVQFLCVLGLGALLIGGTLVLVLVRLGDWHSPASEDEFDAIVRRAEELARAESWGHADQDAWGAAGEWGAEDDPGEAADEYDDECDEYDFRALVRAALDELPLEFHRALEHVAIVVADGGDSVPVGRGRHGAYGLYQGDTVARDHFHDRIVIFRDTLVRDFGHDPVLLRSQVARTVRHELAHHLGWDERGVHDLGL